MKAAYADVIKTAGISTVFSTSETFSNVSGSIYQIDDSDKRIWDRTVVPVVYLDGSTSTPTAIDYLFGTITMASTGTITASGNYLPMSVKSGFNSHSISESSDVLDITTFDNSSGYNRRQNGINDVTIELSGMEIPWFNDFTDCGKNTAGTIDAITDPVSFDMEASHGLVVNDYIRIDNEILLISNVATNTITASRAQLGTNKISHLLGADVFVMNITHFSREPFLVEIRPGGSSDDVVRAWCIVQTKDHSGAIRDLEQNSVSLAIDGDSKASFGQGTA